MVLLLPSLPVNRLELDAGWLPPLVQSSYLARLHTGLALPDCLGLLEPTPDAESGSG